MKKPEYAIRLLKAAEEDFKEIITYIALDNYSAAEIVAENIEKSLSNLSAHPFMGKIPKEIELASMGYRFLVVQNYLIFYTAEEQTVLVHRIIHGARDYLSLL
jgi:toxin ParE1/3/4